GDVPVFRGVLRDVAVEQVKGDAADVDLPDAGVDLPAGQVDGDGQRAAVRVHLGDQRQVEEVVLRVALLLPAVHVQVLPEVPLPVHQADAHERQTEVAGRLQVVAGQHPEAAGVDR